MNPENPYIDPLVLKGLNKTLDKELEESPVKSVLDKKITPSSLNKSEDNFMNPLGDKKISEGIEKTREGENPMTAFIDNGEMQSLAEQVKKDTAPVVDAETQMVVDEIKASEERKKMEKLINEEKEPEISGAIVLDASNSQGEANKPEKVEKPEDKKSLEKAEKTISVEKAKENLALVRSVYAKAREANETGMRKGMSSGEMLAMGKEAADREKEYFEAVALYRASMIQEAGGASLANAEVLKNVLLETVTREAISLHSEKVQAGYESRGGDPKWIKAGKVAAKVGEWYTKQPLKWKLAIGVGLGLGGLALGMIGGAAASTALAGIFAGRTIQRGLGASASGVAIEAGGERFQEKSVQKETLKSFEGNLAEYLIQIGGEADKKILTLEKTEKWNRFKRFATAGTVGALIGSGAFADMLKWGAGKTFSFFGAGTANAQEAIPANSPTGTLIPDSNTTARFDSSQFTNPAENRINQIADRALSAEGVSDGGTAKIPVGQILPTPEGSLNEPIGKVGEVITNSREGLSAKDYIVQPNDNRWHIIRDTVGREGFSNLVGQNPEEIAARKANVIANILEKMKSDPSFGITKENLDMIRPGENIKVPVLGKEVLDSLIERANKLTPEQIQNILTESKKVAGGKTLMELVTPSPITVSPEAILNEPILSQTSSVKLPPMGLSYGAQMGLEDRLNTAPESVITPEITTETIPSSTPAGGTI